MIKTLSSILIMAGYMVLGYENPVVGIAIVLISVGYQIREI